MWGYVYILGDTVKQAGLDHKRMQFEVAESIDADERAIRTMKTQ